MILALPFTLLRGVDTRQAGFSARKRRSIAELGMGRNTKLQLQFDERFWRRAGGQRRVSAARRVPDDVGGDARAGRRRRHPQLLLGRRRGGGGGRRRSPTRPHRARGTRPVAPEASAHWNGRVIRNAWDRHPWSLGSYALVRPGQYTSFYGIEGVPEGHVYFAGEHTSLAAQGYLEGAVESGQRAAREVLASLGDAATARRGRPLTRAA